MSGIEIAGLVLGAIPLFISAASHCRDSLGTVDKFFKKERILNIYIQELETHQTLLRLQLQRVIGCTNLSAKIQLELVDNTTSPLWQRQDVQYQLRRSLADTADIFQSTMKRMADVFIEQIESDDALPHRDQVHLPTPLFGRVNLLTSINYKLGKDQSLRLIVAQSQSSKSSWLKPFSERVKFAWRSPKRNEILNSLKSCNDNLFKLISTVEEAKPYQKKQQVRKVHVAWESRTVAQRLFDVLTSSCTCACQPRHRAKLRIKPCTIDDEDVNYACMLFDISFQRTLNCGRAITVQVYRERQVRPKSSMIQLSMLTWKQHAAMSRYWCQNSGHRGSKRAR
jgi:hypothetical protein